MKKIVIIICGFCAVFYSCDTIKGSKEEGNEYSAKLVFDGVQSILLDPETSYEFYNLQYLETVEGEFLLVQNPLINGINIYDLSRDEVYQKIRIPKEGPNGLKSIQGFTALSLDSIFIYSKMTLNKFVLVDRHGTLLNTYSTNAIDATNRGIVNHLSSTRQATVFTNNKLYFARWPLFDTYTPRNIGSGFSLELEYDFDSDSLKRLQTTYPKKFHEGVWSIFNLLHSRDYNSKEKLFVYSFEGMDSIFTVDSDGSIETYDASLDTDDDDVVKYNIRPNSVQELKDNLSSHRYAGMFYDSYRDVYYRFALRPISFNKSLHRNYKAFESMPLIVIIMDKNFKKIGETELDRGKYGIYSMFVGRDGLYIPQINVNNESLSEERVDISRYVLQSY